MRPVRRSYMVGGVHDLNKALEILRAFVHAAPTVKVYSGGHTFCLYCSGDGKQHDEDCAWAKAKSLLEKVDRANEKRSID